MKYWHCVLCTAASCLSQTATAYASYLPMYNDDSQSMPYEIDCDRSICETDCDRLTYSPLRINLEGIVGDGIGCNNENCALELFFAPQFPCGDNLQTFIDIKGHHLSPSSSWAVNAGIGVRQLICPNRSFGANFFYDYRQYKHTHFNQLGLGLESLGEKLDYRINAYLPFNNKSSSGVLFDDYIGGYYVRASRFRTPMAGFDAEVGMTFLTERTFTLYGALGPYYYRDVGNNDNISKRNTLGIMARLSYQWTQYLEVDVRATYDHLFKTKVQGILQLTLPFDVCFNIFKGTRNACANLLLKPVERREVIVLHRSGIQWTGNY